MSKLTESYTELPNFVDEIIVLSSKDDTEIRNQNAKIVAEETKGRYIEVDGFGHFNLREVPLIENIIH